MKVRGTDQKEHNLKPEKIIKKETVTHKRKINLKKETLWLK